MLLKSTSTLMLLVITICLSLMIELPYEIRFIKAQYNYLFFAILYTVLAILIFIRISLVGDMYLKKLLFIMGLMFVAFPCVMIFSVAVENYCRVKSNGGLDIYLRLIEEIKSGNSFLRVYEKRDSGFFELYGFQVDGSRAGRPLVSEWHGNTKYFPKKVVARKEKEYGQIVKSIRVLGEFKP